MKYSVIIPAYNEGKNIFRSVNGIKRQNIKRSEFEIIVVDNNSSDNTFELAVSAGADIVIKEPKKGTNIARQAGFEKSKGKIVAFLDADSEPPPDWLEIINRDLSKKNVAAVSGPYDYGFKGFKKIFNDIYTRYMTLCAPAILKFIFRKKAGIIIGGNFAAKREAIEAIGGLPPLVFWGDDSTIAMLISRRVGPVLFDVNLVVKSDSDHFKRMGFFKLGFRYMLEYLKAYFRADRFIK